MESKRFDHLLRSLSSGVSRRGVLAGLTGGLLTALPSALSLDDIEARKKGKRKKRKKKKKKRQNQDSTPPSPPPSSPPSPPAAPVTKVDAMCPGPIEFNVVGADGGARLAQTFTALASGPLVSALLPIFKVAGSGGAYILRLSPVDGAGLPTSTVLASAAIPNLSVSDNVATFVTFAFANPVSVVVGTEYALVLTRPGSNQLAWIGHDGNACPGSCFYSPDQTGAFTPHGSEVDLIFTTFVSS